MISAILILAITILVPSGTGTVDDNLRSGQAQHTTSAISKPSSNDDQYASEATEELRSTINDAVDDIKSAEEEEIAKEQSTLNAAIATAGDFVRFGLKKLLGGDSNVSETEIDNMVKEVEERLTEDTTKELRSKADEFVTEEEDRIDDNTTAEEAAGVPVTSIEEDVYEQEEAAIDNVKTEIDETAEQMRKAMREKAQEAEKQILEERLSVKLGKKVKLMIVDDEISGVDDLLKDLSVLKGGEPATRATGTSQTGTSAVGSQAYGGPNSVSASAYNTGSSQAAGAPAAKDNGGFSDDEINN